MKRVVPIVVVLALALTLLPVAAAGAKPGGGQRHGKAKFNLVGTLTAVDADAGTVTVKVRSGTKTVRPYRGADLTLAVDAAARLRLVTADACVVAALVDLTVDAKVKARGEVDRTDPAAPVFIASFLKARALAPSPGDDPAE